LKPTNYAGKYAVNYQAFRISREGLKRSLAFLYFSTTSSESQEKDWNYDCLDIFGIVQSKNLKRRIETWPSGDLLPAPPTSGISREGLKQHSSSLLLFQYLRPMGISREGLKPWMMLFSHSTEHRSSESQEKDWNAKYAYITFVPTATSESQEKDWNQAS